MRNAPTALQLAKRRPELVEAGADFLAVSAAVWGGDEAAAVKAFNAVLAG